jgi:hypothetical protein
MLLDLDGRSRRRHAADHIDGTSASRPSTKKSAVEMIASR